MIYRAIGLMSGSSLDGLDIAYVHFHENAGKWIFDIEYSECYSYPSEWRNKLQEAIHLNALDYQLLHTQYGHYLGKQVNEFINKYQIQYQVQFIASHGHTTFHLPQNRMTAQLGDGSAIAAETGIPVISDLRALDVALGGQGAPIVPIGDKLLFGSYAYCLNIGGIANLSAQNGEYISFDICPANRVLNLIASKSGRDFDEGGVLAASGTINDGLLNTLNNFPYYRLPFPKSLSNDFGNLEVFPLIQKTGITDADALCTYTEHIAMQVAAAVDQVQTIENTGRRETTMLVTGGGAFNTHLVQRLREHLKLRQIELEVPDEKTVNFKEALVMALIGVLRWREEVNVMSSVTGACRNSVGGALWMGH